MPKTLGLSAVFAAVAFALGAGCSGRPPAPGDGSGSPEARPPSGSPEAAFARARDALRAADFAALHDMLSADAKAKAEAGVEKAVSTASAMGPMAPDLMGFDPADLKGLPPRERYVKFMKGAYAMNSTLESALRPGGREPGLAGAELAGSTAEGDRATVTAKLAGGATKAIALVREDGEWKLAEPLSERGDAPPGPEKDGPEVPKGPPGPTEAKPDAPGKAPGR